MCLIWTDLAVHPVGPMLGKLSFSSSLLIQGEGGVSILGCYWAEWDSIAARLEISAAGCCVCQRPVSCSRPLQTHCPSIRRAVTLPLLADTHSPFLFCHLFVHPLFSLCTTSPRSISGTSQLSPMTLANQREASGLMRLLGLAFPREKDKQEWEMQQEEARRRDHRRIGTVGGKSKLDVENVNRKL